MYRVQKCETWEQAPKGARSEFIEAMRGREYDAWCWFLMGWLARDPALHP